MKERYIFGEDSIKILNILKSFKFNISRLCVFLKQIMKKCCCHSSCKCNNSCKCTENCKCDDICNCL